MKAEGRGTFGFAVTLGEAGFERFQIWLDGNSSKVLHPGSHEGVKDVQVHGPVPQAECFGSCWQIDGRHKLQWSDDEGGSLVKVGGPDVGEPGEQYRVKLETNGKYRGV